MTDWTQAALIGWQVLHTILIVVVLGYLLVVNQRLRELRSVRAEVQAWLTEFNKLITSGSLAARELKQSLAMAQLKMPGISAAREGRPQAPVRQVRDEIIEVSAEELAALTSGQPRRGPRTETTQDKTTQAKATQAKAPPPSDPLAKLF